jgi:transcriptional regulator with XRE-family HTH domain
MSAQVPTPLLDALRTLSVPEQHRLAALAGTSRNYIYQLAGCSRRPSVDLASRVARATELMHAETEGRCPVVDLHTIATMCAASR